MDDWQQTVGTRQELLEVIHRLEARAEAAERREERALDSRDLAVTQLGGCRVKLAQVREAMEAEYQKHLRRGNTNTAHALWNLLAILKRGG